MTYFDPGSSSQFVAASNGTADFVVASAVSGKLTPEQANVLNGKVHIYFAQSADGSKWEYGSGAYNTSTHTLPRTTITWTSNGDTNKVNFTSPPNVAVLQSGTSDLDPPPLASLILTEGHAANATTYTLTPSNGKSFTLQFSNGTSVVIPGAGISITVPSGATLSALAATPFRLWVAVFNNNGTPLLAVRTCTLRVSTAYPPTFSIISPSESLLANGTAITSGSNSAHVFYAPSTVTSMPWQWIGYANYESGLASPGTWNVSPSAIVPVDKATPRPGMVIQENCNGASSTGTISLANSRSGTSYAVTITPTSAANLIETEIDGGYIYLQTGSAGAEGRVYITYNGFVIVTAQQSAYSNQAADELFPYTMHGHDFPGVTSLLTFVWGVGNVSAVAGTITFFAQNFFVKERMT